MTEDRACLNCKHLESDIVPFPAIKPLIEGSSINLEIDPNKTIDINYLYITRLCKCPGHPYNDGKQIGNPWGFCKQHEFKPHLQTQLQEATT